MPGAGSGPWPEAGLLHALLDLTADAVLVADAASGRVLYANAALERFLGMPEGLPEDMTIDRLCESGSAALSGAPATGESAPVGAAEARLLRADGSVAPAPFRFRRVTGPDGERLILVAPTAPAGRSEGADHARRLEQIGLLAGGIAHDFNNLLTGILGQASLALAVLPPDSPARGPIHKAAGAAGRAADLTRQLLAYAGKGQYQIASVDLNELIIENIGLQETAMPPRARLRLELAPDLPTVLADRGQMQQVLMNLVINAAEAIPRAAAGRVTVRTCVRHVGLEAADDSPAGLHVAPGDYVCLEVEDSGTGMSPDVLAQIFDPFYSTKGSGRGLGLSALRGIVRAHKGGLLVATAPEQGTRFQVLVPVEPRGAVPEAAASPVRAAAAPAARTTVLVIDDEPAVREVTCDMLATSGIAAMAAADGAEGVTLYRGHHDSIGLVLLDMQMPGLSGEETMGRLRAVDPDVKVVVISGYGETEALRRFTGSGILAFLQKPYDCASLVEAVTAALR